MPGTSGSSTRASIPARSRSRLAPSTGPARSSLPWSKTPCPMGQRATIRSCSVSGSDQPRLYTDLASWFHLLTDPADYAEEAGFYWRCILDAGDKPPRTLLELGSGGGNNASHYKRH